jgi:hypothetical protein
MAMAVPARLWLGGVSSPHRDRTLIQSLVEKVRSCAKHPAVLVCVDGPSSYVSTFQRVFRHPVYTGKRGRPRLAIEAGLPIGQVINQ